MHKILVICGPTATGKTALGLEMAKKYNGEIISADSRQIYTGMDIITGKDLPLDIRPVASDIKWKNRILKYYLVDSVKIWLYDIVNPDEPFNVSFWKDCADLVINRTFKDNKLPVVVGGTGLYLKALSQPLTQITIPPNYQLRKNLSGKDPGYMFNYLNRMDNQKAASLNRSDRLNPRRLIRAIEIASADKITRSKDTNRKVKYSSVFFIGLTASHNHLKHLIDQRISERIKRGARTEAGHLLHKYSGDLPSMTACGYQAFASENFLSKWKTLEYQYLRRQLIWFKKQPNIHWFDVSSDNWVTSALAAVDNWYNKKDHAQKN